MFPGLTIWHRQPIGGLFPGEEHLSQLTSDAYRHVGLRLFPNQFGMGKCHPCLASHVGESLYVPLLTLLGDTVSPVNSLVLCLSQTFYTFCNVL